MKKATKKHILKWLDDEICEVGNEIQEAESWQAELEEALFRFKKNGTLPKDIRSKIMDDLKQERPLSRYWS